MTDRVQFKLWVTASLKRRIEIEAEKVGRSANTLAAMELAKLFFGKPRVRVKMGRAVK